MYRTTIIGPTVNINENHMHATLYTEITSLTEYWDCLIHIFYNHIMQMIISQIKLVA